MKFLIGVFFMINYKPSVVLRSFMCRRDVAGASLLAKCLEHLDYDIKIASVKNFTTILKYLDLILKKMVNNNG